MTDVAGIKYYLADHVAQRVSECGMTTDRAALRLGIDQETMAKILCGQVSEVPVRVIVNSLRVLDIPHNKAA